jgi:hypothetical protein
MKKKFRLDILGLDRILPPNGNIKYYDTNGLTILINGEPGTGKSILALQIALNAAFLQDRHVIYLSKDTNPKNMLLRAINEFGFFGLVDFDDLNDISIGNVDIDKEILDTDWEKEFAEALKEVPEKITSIDSLVASNDLGEFKNKLNNIINKKINPTEESIDNLLHNFFNNVMRKKAFRSSCYKENDEEKNGGNSMSHWVRFGILDHIVQLLKDIGKEKYSQLAKDIIFSKTLNPVLKHSLILFGKLDQEQNQDLPTSVNYSHFETLSYISPNFSEIFNWIHKQYPEDNLDKNDKKDSNENKSQRVYEGLAKAWNENSLIVIDSLPPKVIQEYLRFKSSKKLGPTVGIDPEKEQPIWVFISEESTGEINSNPTFPPDIQIHLGIKQENGRDTRTIEIKKARYQENRTEQYPFSILSISSASTISRIPKINDINKSKYHNEILKNRNYYGIWIHPTIPSFFDKIDKNRDRYKEFLLNKLSTQILKIREIVDYTFIEEYSNCIPLEIWNIKNEKAFLNSVTKKYRAVEKPELNDLIIKVWKVIKIQPVEHYETMKETFSKLDSTSGNGMVLDIIEEILPVCEKYDFICNRLKVYGEKIGNNSLREISFGEDLDNNLMRQGSSLRPGSCTLVLCENRCHSTELGLYYLFAQMKQKKYRFDTLYMTLDSSFEAIKHSIQRLGEIKDLFDDFKIGNTTNENFGIDTVFRVGYKNSDSNKSLYIWPISPKWCACGQILEYFNWLLTPTEEQRIRRVLFSRTDRVQTCLPMVTDTTSFISALIQICRNNEVECMILDDTAEQSSTTGHVNSRWLGLADNIFRLKRVTVHGSHTVAIETLRDTGWIPKFKRPLELTLQKTFANSDGELKLNLHDTFRGYRGLFTDSPRAAKIRLHLPYDTHDSNQKAEYDQITKNLEAYFEKEEIEVQSFGPVDRPGMAWTLSSFADMTQEICHIAALDEIWLNSFFSKDIKNECSLLEFSSEDLSRALPKELKDKLERKNKEINARDLVNEYVTQALSLSYKKYRNIETLKSVHAIPFYHNWGVMAVVKPYPKVMIILIEKIEEILINVTTNSNKKNVVINFLKLISNAGKVSKEELVQNKYSRKMMDFLENIYQLFYCRSYKTPSWEELREFKKDYWDAVFLEKVDTNVVSNNVDTNKVLNSVYYELKKKVESDTFLQQFFIVEPTVKNNKTTVPLNQKKYNFSIEFFDFECGTSESVCSFLLEIILSENTITDVFEYDEEEMELMFLNKPNLWEKALDLIYDLLSSRQRRRIAFLDSSASTGICLFERTWLTSIKPIKPTDEVRHEIILTTLPTGKKDKNILFKNLRIQYSEENEYDEFIENYCEGKGMPVSGAWYLAAFKGGNSELAADVIRELISDERERERIIKMQGAPVTQYNYKVSKKGYERDDKMAEKDTEISKLPYSRLIRILNEIKNSKNKNDKKSIVFPFSRVQIKEYPLVSLELYNMVKEGLKMTEKDKKELKRIVENTLSIILRIQSKVVE